MISDLFGLDDLEYVVPVKVGTPGVSLKLDFDTGSSGTPFSSLLHTYLVSHDTYLVSHDTDLWVFSTALKLSTEQEKEHTIYDPSASSTAKLQSHEKWNISYGDGSVSPHPPYSPHPLVSPSPLVFTLLTTHLR